MRADIQTLYAVLSDFNVSRDNAIYVTNAHMKVLDIRQEASSAMELNLELAQKNLDRSTPMELRAAVEKRLSRSLDYLEEYRAALFAFSFATFLEPLLVQNLTAEKLDSCLRQIREESLRYRELYTRCYDAIEAANTKSIDAVLLVGASSVAKKLSRAVEGTLVGYRTPLDEGLNHIGNGIAEVNASATDRLLARLRAAKSPEVSAFQDALESLNRLANRPTRLAVDRDSVYVLPIDEE